MPDAVKPPQRGAKKYVRGAAQHSKRSRSCHPAGKRTIFTVGHSTRTLPDFIHLLKAHGVKRLVDIRSIPRSRHTPQFNREVLAARLRSAGLSYVYLKRLGGRRHARKGSVNLGWRNASFRGFADYMQTPEFAAGLRRLANLAESKPTAILCAEAVPWRCHRSLIGDALLIRGFRVLDIFSRSVAKPHQLTAFARVRGSSLTYPSPHGKSAAICGSLAAARAISAAERRKPRIR
ncbi:MAG TPA: DUF488 domain-containing protein [Candidatus Acidoferrum sp.]|nr:DUF488 domain-containing protein [Candidatus Acidoferrum sp.]